MTSFASWRRTLGPAGLLIVLGSTLLALGWRRWTHVIIDFGRELYVPWQLSAGKALYEDIAYFNGPLSPYLNSVVFRIFGVSFTVLFLFNLLLLVVTTWLLYRILSNQADRLTAVLGSALFLIIFALADLIGFGNYNFVTPYSHEMTHGTVLSLLLLLILGTYLKRPKGWRLLVIGALLGLIFLTKAEFFLAAGTAVLTGIFLVARHQREGLRGVWERWLPVLAGFAVVPMLAWLLLSTQMSPTTALHGALGPWPHLFNDELTRLIFYRKGLGADAPVENLKTIVVWLGIYAALFGPVWLVARLLSASSPYRRSISLGLSLWVAALLLFLAPKFNLTDLPRPLPVLLAATVLLSAYAHVRRGRSGSFESSSATLLTLEVFALVLLAKMALNARFHNYGFALAMPATIVLVLMLLYQIPNQIDHRGGYGPAFRFSSLVFLVLVGVAFAWPSALVYRQKNTVVGQGADRLLTQDRYGVIQQLLERLPELIEPGETLLVVPEGVMLNYQLRHQNPTPHINFMPPELIMFGEESIIAALEEHPPDVIVLLKRRTIEYGFESIGDGYGEELMRWIGERYPIVETIEDPELWGNNFGRALVLRSGPKTKNTPPEDGAQVP